MESAPHPRQVLFLQLSAAPEQYDILRVKND
ncbi:MAG: U32 family peptidase C-terminal domain-containing protein [Blautia sp.]|nr:U32 family peptidase C-terminal domain-containing protein [Blautia sp.]